jgi:hypothetical protein
MPASSAAIVASLQDAQTTQKAIRIVREHEWCADDLRGFVVGVSGGWAVLQALADAVYCDGYEILRVQDVTEVCDDSKEGYVERAVAVLGRPVVDFRLPAEATTSEVLRAASDHAELISVHTEELDSDALAIGHLYDLGDRDFDLQLIDCEGQWQEPVRWPYDEVTRVTIGDRYASALARFGDPRPTVSPGPAVEARSACTCATAP